MKVPISWLREYVALDMPLDELASRLSLAAVEDAHIVQRGVPDTDGNLGFFRVARVLEAGKHPNADKLQLCQLDVGEGEPRQVVCGAWNFGAGATVAVVLPGAVIPGGMKIEKAKLRGETSNGMILSARELELGPDDGGILLLPDGLEPGTPLADVVPISELVLDFESGFNRPDLLSVYGVAREVAALYDVPLSPPPGIDPPQEADEPIDVRVEDPERCPRYVGRLFRDVAIGESPAWMKARLLAAGMRPISNVVDVTNYVMLALGNPLHAFDRTKLAERRVVVRRAAEGEHVRTLDGADRVLTGEELVIADASRPVAIAGIMGSEDSEVDPETIEVLLEAANFEPVGILRSSERLRLYTEGSRRWEKGVDPHLAEQAAVFATQLLVEHAGARWVGSTDVAATLPERRAITLRPGRATEVAGTEIPTAGAQRHLEALGFEVDGDTVRVPTWRARDVTREIDVVEEILRLHGLDWLPYSLPLRREMRGWLTRDQRLRRLCEDVLVGAGYAEAYTSSLVATDPHPQAIRLPEPLSSEQAVLRTTLLPSLVEAARRNVDAGNDGIALFELARVYLPTGEPLPEERWHLAGIVEGGFFRAKGAVELLYATLKRELRVERGDDAFFHPGKVARCDAGVFGELHPQQLEGSWGAFVLDVALLGEGVRERVLYEDVLSFPPVRQDIAVIVAEDVPAGELEAAMREAAGPELREVRVFDVYRGEQVGEGRKSVAFALAFQSPERTLADEDAAALRERIVAALGARFDAQLRA
jgi:phenylalanyl-tRNA synthetase beta chain